MHNCALVLDTHVWIWLVAGDSRLPLNVRQRIESTFENNVVMIPSICVWEVAMLWTRKRIQLHQPINKWIHDAVEKPGFMLAPLTAEIALESALLPGEFRSDPADSMIIATARVHDALLVSADQRMIAYSKSGHVNVLTA